MDLQIFLNLGLLGIVLIVIIVGSDILKLIIDEILSLKAFFIQSKKKNKIKDENKREGKKGKHG